MVGTKIFNRDIEVEAFKMNGKFTGQLYSNQTGYTAQVLKIHNHATTSGIGSYEGKSDTVKTSGNFYGLWQDANLNTTGTANSTAILGVATVASGATITAGTIIGTYGQARADGTVAGASFMTGLYGLIEASTAITATHVTSCWLDSHQANAVTGLHDLLYMTNNGAATMDQAIYLYGGDKITNLFALDHVSGMVSADAAVGAVKKIKILIDGDTYYLNAYLIS